MLTRLEGPPFGASLPRADVLANLLFDQQRLVAAIAQQLAPDEVLMLEAQERHEQSKRQFGG